MASNDLKRPPARDHKQLGKELEFFTFDDDIGRGLPLWLPNGTIVRDELELLMKELEFAAGFVRVATPHVAKRDLYYRTGHLPYFDDGMFPSMEVARDAATGDGPREVFCLKPMNCPHHHKIFAARKRSYRELPLRLAEYGQCYRYEDSGAVSGLLRVRGMCMNDGHIYCTAEQASSECRATLEMHRRVYEILGLREFRVRLSRRAEGLLAGSKYFDDPPGWDRAEDVLRQVLRDSGLDFDEAPGEAAFYGPKIDFQFRSVSGREETASTLQLDFGMAERLGLTFIGRDGRTHHPHIIHRAPLGTHERFVALLLEHYAGAFPTWLAPLQVRVLPVSDRFVGHARGIAEALRGERVRADVDASDALAKRVRDAARLKVPNVVVVGERECARNAVTLRRYGDSAQAFLPFARFKSDLVEAIRCRSR
jgi:threonyl-tRNA synthetase